MAIRVGMRLRCDECAAEGIVTSAGDAELCCCGTTLSVIFEPAAQAAAEQKATNE